MLLLTILLSVSLLNSPYYTNAKVIDACIKLNCKLPEKPCLEKNFETGSFSCKCAKTCEYVSNKKISKPESTSDLSNSTLKLNSRLVPIAKQGGVACFQSPCMNGGTCFTNYNSYTTAPTTTTTTTPVPYTIPPPLCSCQAQFSGSRCEINNPMPVAPTPAPVVPIQEGWTNLCRVYNDKNMNICQNGGQCVFIADGKVACVCPSTFIGQYCELPLYLQCPGISFSQCHREHGVCLANGSCQCNQNYSGTRCDIPVQNQPYFPPVQTFQPPINTQPPMPVQTQSTCLSYYCLNGGTCRPSSVDPYIICICPPSFTGARCEIFLPGPTVPPSLPQYGNPTQPTNPPYIPITQPTNPPYIPITQPTNPPYIPITQPTNPQYGYQTFTIPTTTTRSTTIGFQTLPYGIQTQPTQSPTYGFQTLPYGNPTQPTNAPYGQGSYQMSSSTLVPRCNFTITLQNDGAYNSRFKVLYTIDGIIQPVAVSPTLLAAQSNTITIPYYAKDVSVIGERYGVGWSTIFTDSNLNTATRCTKCYKVWGVVTNPEWDHVLC